MSVVIETTIGDITVDLLVQERPRTCFNFMKLCKIKFYNCCLFHKIERDFIAQSGDPSIHREHEVDRQTFPGGRSIFQFIKGQTFFEKELVKPRLKHERFGTLSMVDNREGMHGSQFFITLGENLDSLDDQHSVFGYVVEGLEVIQKLNNEICDHQHRPFRDIRITHTVILDDPFDDPPEIMEHINRESPPVWPEVYTSDRIGVEEALDETEGKPLEVIEEELEEKEAKARATILEMIGDLPDADMAPPENVLFICKLNPVTRDDDLEVIFSRFGTIKSCEIIKDPRSGESLQYGFIEFENKEDCEKAYFKMDNVLIDDRRIHVDFSQSVAQYKWKGKGKGIIFNKDFGETKNSDRDPRSDQRTEKYERTEERNRDERIDKDSHKSSRYRSQSRDKKTGDKRDGRSDYRDKRHDDKGDRQRDKDRRDRDRRDNDRRDKDRRDNDRRDNDRRGNDRRDKRYERSSRDKHRSRSRSPRRSISHKSHRRRSRS